MAAFISKTVVKTELCSLRSCRTFRFSIRSSPLTVVADISNSPPIFAFASHTWSNEARRIARFPSTVRLSILKVVSALKGGSATQDPSRSRLPLIVAPARTMASFAPAKYPSRTRTLPCACKPLILSMRPKRDRDRLKSCSRMALTRLISSRNCAPTIVIPWRGMLFRKASSDNIVERNCCVRSRWAGQSFSVAGPAEPPYLTRRFASRPLHTSFQTQCSCSFQRCGLPGSSGQFALGRGEAAKEM